MVFYSYGIGIHNNLNANKSSRKTEYWIIFNYNISFAFKICLKTNLYIYGNSYFEEFQPVSKRYQSGRRLDCDIIAPWCRGWIRLIAGQRMKSRPGLVREWARESRGRHVSYQGSDTCQTPILEDHLISPPPHTPRPGYWFYIICRLQHSTRVCVSRAPMTPGKVLGCCLNVPGARMMVLESSLFIPKA